MRCIVITGYGNFEAVAADIKITESDLVIAADAGMHKAAKLGIVPQVIVGDMDSVQNRNFPENAQVFFFDSIKDDTDTLIAIKKGLEAGCKEFVILGGLGGRLDHTIANLHCLKFLLQQGAKAILADDMCRCRLLCNESEVIQSKYRYLSVFSYGEKAEGVTLSGVFYPLQNAVLTNSFPLGISNKIVEKQASITVQKGILLVIETSEQ